MPTCVVCQKPFVPKRKRQVTCGGACADNRYVPAPCFVKQCAWCGTTFSGVAARVYCSNECSDARFKAKYEEAKAKAGHSYVYLWFDAGARLPYYVGSGVLGRAWEEHEGLRAPATVTLLRDGLTPDGALFLESSAIRLLRLLGAELENLAEPCATQPEGKLEC